MSYKTFFINNNKTDFKEKQVVAKSLYPKYFIRNSVKTPENKNSLLVDTEDLFFLSLKKTASLGFSFYAKKFIFAHKLNKNLQFSSFLCYTRSKKEYVSRFLKSLNRFVLKPISKRYLFLTIIKPVKGGFIGFCNNFFGFVPRSQFNFMVKAFSKRKTKSSKMKVSLFTLNYFKEWKRFLSYKLRVRGATVTLLPCTVRSAFSGRSKYHFLRRKNKINFVFIYKKLKRLKRRNIKKYPRINKKKYLQKKKFFSNKNKISSSKKKYYVKKDIQHKKTKKATKFRPNKS